MSLAHALVAGSKEKGLAVADREAIMALRQAFIADPGRTDLSLLRPVIARSWRRSVLCNVDPGRHIMEMMAEPQLDDQLLRVAGPILAELEYICRDVSGCMSLSDPMGTIAVFRGEPGMVRWAENTFPTVGGSMSEDIVGTNSDGTAIEEGRAVQTWGSEHFNDALQNAYCTSVPIVDPLRKSIRGVLSLCLPERVATDIDPRSAMLVVHSAALEITRALAAKLADREQALLVEYLREARKRGAEAVVAMDEQTLIMNRRAMQSLDQNDHAVLAALAREAGHLDQPTKHEVHSGSDEILQLRIRSIDSDTGPAGTVMRLRRSREQRRTSNTNPLALGNVEFQGLVGESASFNSALRGMGNAAERGLPVCLFGEAGTGKRHFARALVSHLAQDTPAIEVSLDDDRPDFGVLAGRVRRGDVVLVHRAELIDRSACDLLAASAREAARPMLILTSRELTEQMQPLVAVLKGIEINLLPLRNRREDIPLLVEHFLRNAEAPKRAVPRLVEMLAAAEWPGNITQLKEVVLAAALHSSGREVRIEDLTEMHRKALAPSRLSRLQKAEFQEIRQALIEAGGNRVRAAAILKIGRSTLYRRIDFYISRGFDLPLHS